jgi:hypothetical protein
LLLFKVAFVAHPPYPKDNEGDRKRSTKKH